MKQPWKKFLSALLSFALLAGLAGLCAAPAKASPALHQPENYPEHFAGTPGPDDLDVLLTPSKQQKALDTKNFTDIKNIVVFINFSGMTEFVTEKRLNTAEQVYNQKENSLKGYVDHLTYGQIHVDSHFYPKNEQDGMYYSYVDPQPIGYYKTQSTDNPLGYTTSTQRFTRERELVSGAFAYIKEQVEADFSDGELDNNNDGRIDSIAFIVNGYSGSGGGIAWNDLLWPHKISSSGLYLHNKQISSYNLLLTQIPPSGSTADDTGIMSENPDRAKHTVIIHEFLHTLGLPDLYHYSSAGDPVGEWDILASTYMQPQNMLQYMQREYMGWGKPIHEATTSGSYTLQAAKYEDMDADGGYDGSPETALILRSPVSSKEFFVVEYRKRAGFDAGLPGSGLIIYRVNPSIKNGNSNGPPELIYVFRPDETSTSPNSYARYANFSSQSGRTSIGKASGAEIAGFDSNVLYYSDGTNSGIIIDQIGAAGDDTMTFRLRLPTPAITGDGTADNPYLIETAAQMEYLRKYPERAFRLCNSLSFSPGFSFEPIPSFSGSLDGDGHTISGLTVASASDAPAGLFGSLASGAEVKNLTLQDGNVSGGLCAGILAGEILGTIRNVTVNGGQAAGLISGGLCGMAKSGAVISGCTSCAAVTGNIAGGLAGQTEASRWTDCFSSGKVTGDESNASIGGLFGKQIVSGSYQPGERLYWAVTSSGMESGTQVQLEDGAASYTGQEGMTGLRLPALLRLKTGDTIALEVETVPAGQQVDGSWSIDASSAVSLTGNTLTGVSSGRAEVRYTLTLDSCTASIVIPVTVELVISSLKIVSGDLTVGSPLTFQASAGSSGREAFSYYLFRSGQLCYQARNVASDSFRYQPAQAGDYTLVCYCSIPGERMASSSLRFTVAG